MTATTLPPVFSWAATSCAVQVGEPIISSSGSSTANGSSPIQWRAHHTAWPRPSGFCWRVKIALPGLMVASSRLLQLGLLVAALDQRGLELVGVVEMILDRALVAAGDEDEFLDAGGEAFLDRVLDQRPVDDRQHFLGHRLGRRQEARAQAGDRQNGFTDALGHVVDLVLENHITQVNQ